MVYRIQIIHAAQKQILDIPEKQRMEIVPAIDALANIPRPVGCKKLRGIELWRFRLGRYRVIYQIDDTNQIVTVVRVALRQEDTYRGL